MWRMKTLRALLCLSVALPLAITLNAQSKPDSKAKPAATEPAEEKEGKIEGLQINRPNGRYLGLTVEGGQWKLTFYDKKKKPEPTDVTRANIRWVIPMKSPHERAVLNPGGDGKSLVGNRFVRPPYVFQVFITMLSGEGDDAEVTESYALQYRG
jgi:hypothetical protein